MKKKDSVGKNHFREKIFKTFVKENKIMSLKKNCLYDICMQYKNILLGIYNFVRSIVGNVYFSKYRNKPRLIKVMQ